MKEMKRQFAVIGLGRFGTSVALTLQSLGHDVLAIDSDDEQVQQDGRAVALGTTEVHRWSASMTST